jgi:hypothetical protein
VKKIECISLLIYLPRAPVLRHLRNADPSSRILIAGKGCEDQKVQLSRRLQTDHFVRDLFSCISVHHALARVLVVVAKECVPLIMAS